ncbi:hypothetical protein BGP77_02820 [Saccharospirillum sp. MSK14-1]|uniref:DUF3482 domain-containing protein n=1 Tax=Saccharospirillum sp. MSK14-1 TaxID=1897632 RepID=UPI000D391995|nr:DUF3482 domain-containing protein [Saccharospirillum sp. MSK14-1]PTY36260.1 hypothetical protein BGP77_02820 [Saccharospirillum sp. MSK14-1]
MSDSATPRFAVVGHPNQGKSSLVSTLVQDDHIAVSPISGTTQSAHRYQLLLADQVLYELVDTPGFQRARQILDWCNERAADAAERPAVLASFVAQHRDDRRFSDDCALLEPILNGAGIVYVVDVSQPFGSVFDAELQLLSWTAQPRLALLNPIGNDRHAAQWQTALSQYFSLVRRFDPLVAPFEQHLALLRSLAEVHPPWREALIKGVDALSEQRQQRHDQAAQALLLYFERMLHLQLQLPMVGPRDQVRAAGLAQYNQALQQLEKGLRTRLAEIYGHGDLDWRTEWQALAQDDLTDAREWRVWGLSRARLASLSGAAGALSGLAVDAAAGGTSLLLGAVSGGVLGGLAGGFAGRNGVTFQWVSRVPGYEHWQLGPMTSLDFALAMIGRALRCWYQLRQRNHARRDVLDMGGADFNTWLSGLERKQQVQWLYWVRRLMKRSLTEAEVAQFTALIAAIGYQMDILFTKINK